MKKTLLASAIAAVTFSGGAFAQSSLSASELAAKMDSMPEVYGNIQYALTHASVDGGGSTVEHADNGSTLGIKHDHQIASGVTGFFKLELEGIAADDKRGNKNNTLVSDGKGGFKVGTDNAGANELDEAYIGVKGDFGQVWVGSDDGVYERAVVKIGNFHEVGSDIFSAGTTSEGDQVQYQSPSFGGLTLGAGVQVNGDGEGGEKSYPYQFSATYAVDALSVAVAMDSNDGPSASNENTYGLAATYSAGNVSLTGEYQTRSDFSDIYGVIGVYTMGANQFSLSYQVQDDDATGDSNDTVVLQALHNLSDHMYVYFEGYLSSADDAAAYSLEGTSSDEQTIGAVGAVYYF